MSISIQKALNEPFSNKYDKIAIAVFLCLNFIYLFCYYFSDNKNIHSAQIAAILGVFSFILSIIISGYVVILNYNNIKKRNNPFPSLLDCAPILIKGFKMVAGVFLTSLFLYFPFFLISAVLFAVSFTINHANSTLGIISFLITLIIMGICAFYITFRGIVPLILMYYSSPKFKTFFMYKKIKAFLEPRKKYYWSYIWKTAVIGLLMAVSIFILSFIIFIAIGLVSSAINQKMNISTPVSTLGIFIVAAIINTYFTIVFSSLNEQFVNSVKIINE